LLKVALNLYLNATIDVCLIREDNVVWRETTRPIESHVRIQVHFYFSPLSFSPSAATLERNKSHLLATEAYLLAGCVVKKKKAVVTTRKVAPG